MSVSWGTFFWPLDGRSIAKAIAGRERFVDKNPLVARGDQGIP
jgi:hypothetical protein